MKKRSTGRHELYTLSSAYDCVKEFPQKNRNKNGFDALLRKIHVTGTVDRKPGSGRLVLSQENAPQTHSTRRTTRQISRETGVSRTTVNRIIHKNLNLKF